MFDNDTITKMAQGIKDTLEQLKAMPIEDVKDVEEMSKHIVELQNMKKEATMVKGLLKDPFLINILQEVIDDMDEYSQLEAQKIVDFTSNL